MSLPTTLYSVNCINTAQTRVVAVKLSTKTSIARSSKR